MKALLIVFLFFSAYISSPSRTFTSSDGLRTIDATLLTVNEASKTITIRRSDGKSFHANLSAFSYSDQAYARQWLKGKKENYLLVGREYPSHLKIYLNYSNPVKSVTVSGSATMYIHSLHMAMAKLLFLHGYKDTINWAKNTNASTRKG